MARKSLEERFLEKVDFNGIESFHPCWEWIAWKLRNGYGRINVEGRKALAHRVAYYLYRDHDFPIFSNDFSIVLDHYLCQNKCCVNPFHLELVTFRENISRGRSSDMNGEKTSEYRGVYWNKRAEKWRAKIQFEGKQKHLGYFDNEEEAAEAYQKALEASLSTI